MTTSPAVEPYIANVSSAVVPEGPDPHRYRQVVGRFATGVTVVSTVADGVRYGMTVNSFTSVSLDPLLVLFCCEIDCAFYAPVMSAGRWGVSVLSTAQVQQSRWFAVRGRAGVDQFDGQAATVGPATGVPLLAGSLATFECRTFATYDGGDHTVVVGEVLDATSGVGGEPLLYVNSAYGTAGSLPRPPVT
jgi:flavin reductase (DIM6/NTAB) family NADH-FMN oxidoreductase RutF